MSILVLSTRQTDSGRTSFAAAASFSALLFAASPTISIRSGMSRATFSALSPIDPVAPKTTTRLRFIFRQNEQNNQNNSRKSERNLLFLRKAKLFLKFQPLGPEIQTKTFVESRCDE